MRFAAWFLSIPIIIALVLALGCDDHTRPKSRDKPAGGGNKADDPMGGKGGMGAPGGGGGPPPVPPPPK